MSPDRPQALLDLFRDKAHARVERLSQGLEGVRRRKEVGVEEFDVLMREAHTLKGEAGMLDFGHIRILAHALEDLLAEARAGRPEVVRRCVGTLLDCLDGITGLVEGEIEEPEATTLVHGLMEALRAGAGADGEGIGGENTREAGPAPAPLPDGPRSRYLRVDQGALERLAVAIQEVGQLVDSASRQMPRGQELPRELRASVERASEMLSRIDERVVQLRMQPLSTLTRSFPRAVRELGRQLSRRVHLDVEGDDVLLDQEVLEHIEQPLLHMVRNAVDHGVEPPEERFSAGKPRAARLVLSGELVGNDIRISLQDDGRGVDPDLVRERAVEAGLLSREVADSRSDHEALELLFQPGFSTRREASELSGRGFGLDVVRSTVEALGGSSSIRSIQGEGTTVTFRVPVTRAIARYLIVERGGARFAIPARSVTNVAVCEPSDLEHVGDALVLRHRGQRYPLVDIAKKTGALPAERPPPGDELAVLVEHRDRVLGIRVDRCLQEDRAIRQPFEGLLAAVYHYSGVVRIPGHEIILLLDVPALFAGDDPGVTAGAPRAVGPAPTILLVEDSDVTRSLVADVLRSFGFVVEEAFDGLDGLERLERTEVDLVLTDLEMPRLDGFGFIEALRSRAATAETPIIVLSTHTNETDRRRAREAGADDYIAKADFHEKVLRDAVERLLEAQDGGAA